MDVRPPLFQNVASVLVGVMFLNPIVSAAADLTVAAGSGATLDQARNGVPVVNIAAPNGNGLSHNKFKDYNVGQQGLILNNATNNTQATQLGGIILGNPSLKGRAAGLILNEVTGANASRLQGYTEVAGKSAHVVVANPHGITCDGCGFINTPRVTLSTGTPMIENGRLDRFDVNGGSIAIEGLGLNASNVDQFDLITRSAKINAELHANKLNIITGRNEVKADNLSVTTKATDGSDKPLLAIDSSALGGMYAGAIRLVGTEAGVGVKLAGDMAASAGDIQIDANGQLSMGRAAASRDISLKAQAIELGQAAYAGRAAHIEAEGLSNQVSLATGGDLSITARQIDNAQNAVLEAGLRADDSTNAAATLTVTGENLNNAGDIVSHGALNADLKSLSNRATVLATGEASINAETLDNEGGTLIGQQALKITGDHLNNRAGTVASNGALDVALSGDLDNRDDGILLSKDGALAVTAQTLNNRNGTVQAGNGTLAIAATTLNNTAGNIAAAQGALNLDAVTTHNQGGRLQGSTLNLTGQTLNNGGGLITSSGQAQLMLDTLNNANGTLLAATDLIVTATDLSNNSGKVGAKAIDLSLTGKLGNNNGLIESGTTLSVTADQASNTQGRLRALGSGGHSQFSLGRLFDNTSGLVEIGNATFTLGVPSLKNQGGTVRHLGTAGFDLGMENLGGAGGSFITSSRLELATDDWTNTSQIQAAQLDLDIKRLTQTATGALLAVNSLDLAGDHWINDGRIETDGDLALALTGDYSGNGALLAQDGLTLSAANINIGLNGELRSGGFGTFTAAQSFNNAGVLTATTGFELSAASVLNQGTLGSAEELRVATSSLNNVGGLIFSGADMSLFANQLTNRKADIYSLGNLLVAANPAGDKASRFSNLSGTVESAGWMTVAASLLENARETFEISSRKISARLVYTGCGDCGGSKESSHFRLEEIDVTQATNVSDQAQLLAGQDMTLRSDTLDNRYSLIASGANIQIDTDVLRNQGAQAGKITTTRNLSAHRVYQSEVQRRRVEADAFTAKNWIGSSSYNPGNITSDLNRFIDKHVYRISNPGTPTLSDLVDFGATIQGAGKVTINARERFDNSVIRPSFAYVSGGNRVANTQPGSSIATTVTFNPQLPPDLSQKVVDPLTLPGFSFPQGQNGMFHFNPSGSHNYLIETNPAFANLKNFLSSDYMLGLLGYDTDVTQKRLGDGFYEQRLVREAIVARTGQRYLAGLTSDEAMFRHLMDNAIASKDALGLSLGVSLTAEQVAALTHDIVWMEEREVMGEKVLVPMLYLAQAEGRLAPTGALIQGQDVALISGSGLNNQGTLRASQNLDITAGNITNSGLMHANERLSLLAGDSIRNTRGGILKGQDVSLVAVTGDVVNERTVSNHHSTTRHTDRQQSFVDSAARVEAGNDLVVSAGNNIRNIGGAISAGGDASLQAGNDLILGSAEAENRQNRWDRKGHSYRTDITQYGSEVQVGGDLQARAGHDLSVVASQLKAGDSLELRAGGDLLISSAANENHFFSRSKKVTQSRDQVTQQSSVIQAGRDLSLDAGNDLSVIASRVTAANNVDLNAGQDINILSAKDESASFYFKKSKGSFGRSKSTQKENYDSTNIASVIEAGNDLTINTSKTAEGGLSLDGGRDVAVIGSQLSAGNDLLLGATGDIAVLSGVEEHGSYSKKTKSGFLGMSKSGKSQLKTSTTQVASELEAGNDVVIAAGTDIRLRASTTEAGNDVELRSGLIKNTGDINLVSANDTAYSLTEQYKKKTGLSVSGGMLSVSSAKKAGQEARSSTSVGSHVVAERDASLLAERDINVIGSSVSAGSNLLLDAGRDVNIAAAQNQQGSTAWERERRTGIGLDSDRNGFTAFVGNDVQIEKGLKTWQTAAASVLEAGNDLDVTAGRDANLSGSDFSAGRDINVVAERDINLDVATERHFQERQEVHQRNGLTVNVSHNLGNTVDAIKGIGQGENLVSQGSGFLKAADAVTQFVSGPTTANHLGTTRQQTTTTDGVLINRPTTLNAGRDVNLQADNDINAKGSQIQAERDVSMSGRNITLDVARGQQASSIKQVISQNGISGGTTFNSARAGVGGSHGVHFEKGTQGTALETQVQAGRDIHLEANRDLELIGTRTEGGRDISLVAGNDIDIRAAQNDSEHEMRRKSGGGEVGVALGGQDLISVYASVNIGKGRLDREVRKQQEAYLYAGKQLSFESGRDTTVTGARLEGQDVVGKVGRDLLVSSAPDTGKVAGKELDASLTVSVGLYGSVSVSGSVGVGKTNGSTNWVENQTGIVARDRLDIRTENHSQLDGALLASESGDLTLDTGTLGFRDIEGHHREHAWYINAGGTYSWGGDTGSGGQPADGNGAATNAVVDPSQQNKDGSNNWNLSGYDFRKERDQIVRATVGEGEVVVRSDTETGRDSTAGLNRNVSKAYEITKDKEKRTDLYVSKSSVEALSDPVVTLDRWKNSAESYGRNSVEAFTNLEALKEHARSAAEHDNLVAALAWAPALLVDAMDAMGTPTLGIFPGAANHGGLITQLPVLVPGDLQPLRVTGTFKTDTEGKLVLAEGKPILDPESLQVQQFAGFNEDEDKIFTNGIMNSMMEALANGLMQSGSGNGEVSFVLAYNPAHGLIGDLIESTFDKSLQGTIHSGTARNLNGLFQQGINAGPDVLHIYGHSQGGLLTWVAIKGLDFSNGGSPTATLNTIQLSGAPVDAIQFHKDAETAGFEREQSAFQVNRPDETVFFGLLPKTDTVADLPLFLGGNAKYSDDPLERTLGALFTTLSLFGDSSPHSRYSCVTCPPPAQGSMDVKIRDIVIKPTLIDIYGNVRMLDD